MKISLKEYFFFGMTSSIIEAVIDNTKICKFGNTPTLFHRTIKPIISNCTLTENYLI